LAKMNASNMPGVKSRSRTALKISPRYRRRGRLRESVFKGGA
jgi:hypothetical protein